MAALFESAGFELSAVSGKQLICVVRNRRLIFLNRKNVFILEKTIEKDSTIVQFDSIYCGYGTGGNYWAG